MIYHTIALRFANRCVEPDAQPGQKEIAVYGAELLISSAVEIIIVLTMGAVFHRLLETILFLMFFCPLRSVAGGYHAPGYRSCTLIFSSIFLIMILVLQPMPFWLQMLLLVASSVSVWTLAPVEDFNKPLGKKRGQVLRRKSKYYLIVELILYALTYISFSGKLFQTYLVCSFTAVSVLLFIGYIKNKTSGDRASEKGGPKG